MKWWKKINTITSSVKFSISIISAMIIFLTIITIAYGSTTTQLFTFYDIEKHDILNLLGINFTTGNVTNNYYSGGGAGANVSTTTCSGTDKVSAINNATGVVTCSADQSAAGGGGANVSTTTCSGTDKISAINNSTGAVTCSPDDDEDPETDPIFSAWDKSTGISITESQISDLQDYLLSELDPWWSANYTLFNTSWSSRYNSSYEYWTNSTLTDYCYNSSYLTSYTENDPLWSGNYSLFNTSWSSTFNSTYDAKVSDNTTWNETTADLLYCPINEPLWSGNYSAFNSTWSSTYNASYMTNTYNATYDTKVSDNSTWNEAYANDLYCTISEPLWSGNYSAFNASWSSTYNSTYDAKPSNGDAWINATKFNATTAFYSSLICMNPSCTSNITKNATGTYIYG